MKILCLLSLSLLHAADSTWTQTMQRARDLQSAGNYTGAEIVMTSALALAEKFDPSDTRLARSLSGLASVNQDLAKYAAAEKLYRRAIAAIEQNLGRDDQALFEPLNGLASLYYQMRRYAQAEQLTLRCLAVPQDRHATAQQLGNLAAVYQAERRYAEADDYYRRALDTFESPSSELAFTLNNLGSLRMSMGNPREAAGYLERAVAMWESTVGASHPVYAQGLGNLAYLYSTIGQTAEAESLWTRALALAEKSLGSEHPIYAALLNGYADSLQHSGRKAEANRIRRRSQAILPANSALIDYRDLLRPK